MSALPPKVDILQGGFHVRYVPLTDMKCMAGQPRYSTLIATNGGSDSTARLSLGSSLVRRIERIAPFCCALLAFPEEEDSDLCCLPVFDPALPDCPAENRTDWVPYFVLEPERDRTNA